MPNFTLESRMQALDDIQRQWKFEVSIPSISDIIPNVTAEGITIHAKSFVLPGRTNTPIESVFMGFKQFFAGKENFQNTADISFEETEDQYITKAIYAWKEKIFTTKPTSNNAGNSQAPAKRKGLVTNLFLKMYRYNGDPLEKMVRFVNGWPVNIADVAVAYSDDSALAYTVTFQYDFWELM